MHSISASLAHFINYPFVYGVLVLLCYYYQSVPTEVAIFCCFFWTATSHNGFKPFNLHYNEKQILTLPSEIIVSLIATLLSQCIQVAFNAIVESLIYYAQGQLFAAWVLEIITYWKLGDYVGCIVVCIPFCVVNDIAYRVSLN